MRKIGALFHNEMLKTVKKVSVFVIAIIMTVGMIGCSALIKSFGSEQYDSAIIDQDYYIDQETQIRQEIQYYENLLASDPKLSESDEIHWTLLDLKRNYYYYYFFGSYARDNQISPLSYKYAILSELETIKTSMLELEYYPSDSESDAARYQSLEEEYARCESAVKNSSYAAYIAGENERIHQDPGLSEARKEALIEYNNALLDLCPTGEYATAQEKANAESLLNRRSAIQSSLKNGVNLDSEGNLTAERRTELEQELKLVEANIAGGIISSEQEMQSAKESFSLCVNLGLVFVIVILIILAGSSMSHEISTGTIKSLIIAPVRRWKIYTAKYLSLLVTMLILSLYVFAVSFLLHGFLYGFGNYGKEIYVVAGKAVSLSYFTAQFVAVIFRMIPLLVFTTFAYLLSIVTKNTAASVSVSLGLYLGGSVIHMLLTTASVFSDYSYLMKFLPFSNFELFSRVFYGGGSEGNTAEFLIGAIAGNESVPVAFSVVYIIILLVCMISVGLDHFCRRDIK